MQMGLSVGCYQTQSIRQSLAHEHKLQLRQLLQVQQQLRHPEYPAVVRGLEGMLQAHQILQKKEAVGVLIGGLSEAVWNQQCTPEDLMKHKDVDVMVLNDEENGLRSQRFEKFEGGIDWWLPNTGKIDIITDYSERRGVEKHWWKNANGVVLSFGLEQHYDLSAGLYIPDASFVRKMREYEVLANVDTEIEYEAVEAFERKMEQRVKTSVPKCIRERFTNYILSQKYESSYRKTQAIELDQFERETMKAIYKKAGVENQE